MRSRPEVHYVEAEDLSQVAFVRCTGADAARSLVEQNIWKQSEILQGTYQRPLPDDLFVFKQILHQ